MVYYFSYLDEHNITPLGILNFSTGRWDHLKSLKLNSGNHPFIGDQGCKYLSRVSLPRIESMNLSKHQLKQIETISLHAEWPIYQRPHGKHFKHSPYILMTTEPLNYLLLSQNKRIDISACKILNI
jgi:hypothetical protein